MLAFSGSLSSISVSPSNTALITWNGSSAELSAGSMCSGGPPMNVPPSMSSPPPSADCGASAVPTMGTAAPPCPGGRLRPTAPSNIQGANPPWFLLAAFPHTKVCRRRRCRKRDNSTNVPRFTS